MSDEYEPGELAAKWVVMIGGLLLIIVVAWLLGETKRTAEALERRVTALEAEAR